MKHVMPIFPDPVAPVPAHHPAEELLLDYAAGSSTACETLLLATHLAYCDVCRRIVQTAQRVGGTLFESLEPARLPPNMLNRTLAAIDAAMNDPIVAPPPLSRFLSDHMASTQWKRLPGGFRMHRIPSNDGSGRTWLFDAPPGMKLMPHRHVGDEWTVVLSGLLVDNQNGYRVGDFARLADGEEHAPAVGDEGRCVSLIMVRDNPLYTTFAGRLAAPFVKL